MSDEGTPRGSDGRSGMLLAVAMGLGNLLSYAFVVILTRALGTSGFGAYTALITLGIVLVIPAGAFQVVVARRWTHRDERTSGLRAATTVGLALTAVTAAAAPGVDRLLHLDGVSSTVAMSMMLLPMTLTGAFQGVLLGSGSIARLAALYVVTAAARVAGALGCAAVGADVTQVFVVMAAAAWIAAAFGWWMCGAQLSRAAAHSPGLVREMWRSNSTLAAFTALTNVDVLLVRHFLAAETSGAYGLASTFARAMCWGTQFLALLIVPRLAARSAGDTSPQRALMRAAALVVTIGATAAAGVTLLGADGLVAGVGGRGFEGNGTLVLACLGLGTLWALAQLWLFSQMADDDTRLGTLAWLMVAVELVVGWLWLHDSVWHIIALACACAGVVVVVGAVRAHRSRVTALEETTDLLAVETS